MTDHNDVARSAAYSGLVSALVGARVDPATDRFDEELAAAEASGAVDPVVARTLRWWQRESVRAVEEHLLAVLPGVLTALAASDRDARRAVAASAESWAAATGTTGRGPQGPPPEDPPPGSGRPASPTPPDRTPPGATRPVGDPGGVPHLRPVDSGTGTARPLRPGFAPRTPEASAGSASSSTTGDGAPPRRLLVGGITVLSQEDGPHARHVDGSGSPE